MKMKQYGMNMKIILTGVCLSVLMCAAFSEVRAEEQLLKNPNFDSPRVEPGQRGVVPDHWFTFSSGDDATIYLSLETAKQGNQSLRFISQGTPNAFQGACQKIDVEVGKNYEFVANILIPRQAGGGRPGAVRGQLSVEWLNDREEEIMRSWGPVWTQDLTPGTWYEFSLTALAPIGAVHGVFVITQFDAGGEGEQGVFHADEVSVWRLP